MRDICDFLERAGLIPPGHAPEFEPLAGGVSSDIWLVRAGASRFCVKQALGRLRVVAEWRAEHQAKAAAELPPERPTPASQASRVPQVS